MMDFFEEIIWRFIHKYSLSVNYTFKVSKNAPWAYVSYLPEACYRKGVKFLNKHQNRRESKVLVEVLHELGFNVFVGQYNDTHNDLQKLPTPRLIFGLEPNFERACKLWPDAMKIYYATGAYYKHQNNMIRKRTDEFNLKYGAHYPYQRLVSESDRYEKADYIFQIGSSFTKETYPEHLREKIRIIRQSNTLGLHDGIEKDYSNKTDYLWLGSSGTILKGLDLVVEYFKAHPEFTLHVVGNADSDFIHTMGMDQCTNIHFYGFIDTSSEQFRGIARKCSFLVYPSCTEGGVPGAVINSMLYGIVPIVTRWAAFDEVENLGYLLEDMTIEAIVMAIDWSQSLSEREVAHLSQACQHYAQENYTLAVFKDDMIKALKEIIEANGNTIL